jgi:hypothetical protein
MQMHAAVLRARCAGRHEYGGLRRRWGRFGRSWSPRSSGRPRSWRWIYTTHTWSWPRNWAPRTSWGRRRRCCHPGSEATRGGAQYALDITGVPAVIAGAIDALRPTGTIGLVGAGSRNLVIAPYALSAGKNVMGILEGNAVPQVFLPHLIELWRQGRFPFDKQQISAGATDEAGAVPLTPRAEQLHSPRGRPSAGPAR